MSVILIDGIKYLESPPQNEQELEDAVREHSDHIFGPDSVYLERKQLIKSASGIKGIPDGIVFVAVKPPEWHIVEVELSDHPLHKHVIPQVSKFIQATKSQETRKQITKAIHSEINSNPALKTRIVKLIGESTELYEFISDTIDKLPVLTLVVEKDSQQIQEGLDSLSHPTKKVVEFRTYNRDGVGHAEHAHLFEPLYAKGANQVPQETTTKPDGGRITIRHLIASGLLKPGQKLFKRLRNGSTYESYIREPGVLEIKGFGQFDSPSTAAVAITQTSINGWTWWQTEHNGKTVKLDELRSMIRLNHH